MVYIRHVTRNLKSSSRETSLMQRHLKLFGCEQKSTLYNTVETHPMKVEDQKELRPEYDDE